MVSWAYHLTRRSDNPSAKVPTPSTQPRVPCAWILHRTVPDIFGASGTISSPTRRVFSHCRVGEYSQLQFFSTLSSFKEQSRVAWLSFIHPGTLNAVISFPIFPLQPFRRCVNTGIRRNQLADNPFFHFISFFF